jgi:hypothetical protein
VNGSQHHGGGGGMLDPSLALVAADVREQQPPLAALIFVTYGYQFAKFGSIQQSEISGLPMLTIYIAWPLAGLTWLAFLGEKFREDFRIFRGEMPPPEHEIVKVE